MRVIKIIVYRFDELPDDVRNNTIKRYRYINVEKDICWWQPIIDEAEQMGVVIADFDLYKNTIIGTLTKSIEEVAQNLLNKFDNNSKIKEYERVNPNKFIKIVLNEYLDILRKKYEYMTSVEAVIATLKDYEFTNDGKICYE